jgi:hypothetical protein
MKRFNALTVGATLATIASTLACATVTNLGSRPTAIPVPPPVQQVTQPPAAEAPFTVAGGGPTVGTPREARIAAAEGALYLENLAAETYTQEQRDEIGLTLDYTVEMTQAQPLLWSYGWCATDREKLLDNWAKMELEFVINDTRVDESQFNSVDTQQGELQCRTLVAVLDDWPADNVTIETIVTFTEPMNDGLADYPAGEKRLVYRVTAP